jgi:hypothetical protein
MEVVGRDKYIKQLSTINVIQLSIFLNWKEDESLEISYVSG